MDEDLAGRFLLAVDQSIRLIGCGPGIGKFRKFQDEILRDIRSFSAASPFGDWLIFYRHAGDCIYIERVMHGARDLPRRLAEPPQ